MNGRNKKRKTINRNEWNYGRWAAAVVVANAWVACPRHHLVDNRRQAIHYFGFKRLGVTSLMSVSFRMQHNAQHVTSQKRLWTCDGCSTATTTIEFYAKRNSQERIVWHLSLLFLMHKISFARPFVDERREIRANGGETLVWLNGLLWGWGLCLWVRGERLSDVENASIGSPKSHRFRELVWLHLQLPSNPSIVRLPLGHENRSHFDSSLDQLAESHSKNTETALLFFEIYRSFQPLEIYLTRRYSVAVPTFNLISTSIVSRVSYKFIKFSSSFPGKLLTDSATLQFFQESLSDFSVVQQSSRDPSHWSKTCAKCHDHDNVVVTINHVRTI